MDEAGGSSTSLESKMLTKQHQIDQTSASLEREEQKLEQMRSALEAAGVDTTDLTNEEIRLKAKTLELEHAQEDVAESADKMGDETESAADKMASALAAAGITAALKKIYDGFMECVSAAQDFEATMSTVEALSGASGEELDSLSAKAKELGATTIYTATEAAQAMTYMGMAGWDAQEMLQGMDGVIQLASASGEDLATTADIVTDNLTAFGMSASDTSHFADVLAATATNSNTSVSIMGETFKNAASIAGALGYSVEDVSVAIGLMANSGVKGSLAGTALKNTFNGLLEGATLTSAAFGEYEFSALNADGTMKSFSDTIEELREQFDQMTEAEKVTNAQAIAGNRSYNGLLAILNATDEEYESLAASIANCDGAAQSMANIKLDNAQGELTLLKSAWDGLTIAIGETFTDAASDVYKALSNIVNSIQSFVKSNPTLVKAVAAATAIFGAATAGVLAFAAAEKVAALASESLSASIPVLGVITALAAAIAAVSVAAYDYSESLKYPVDGMKDFLEECQEMQDSVNEVSSTLDSSVEETAAAADIALDYIDRLEELNNKTELTNEEQNEYAGILQTIVQLVPDLADCIDTETGELLTSTAELRANTEAWKENAEEQAKQEALSSLYSTKAQALVDAAVAQANYNRAVAASEQAAIDEAAFVDAAKEAIIAADVGLDEATLSTMNFSNAMSFLSMAFNGLDLETWTDDYAEISSAEAEAKQEMEAYGQEVDAANAVVDEAQAVINDVTDAFYGSTDAANEAADANSAYGEASDTAAAQVEAMQEKISQLAIEYQNAYNAAYESISGQYQLWDSIEEKSYTIDELTNNLEAQTEHWNTYNDNLQILADRAASGDDRLAGLSDMIASFADGSEDSTAAVAAMAEASDDDLADMVAAWEANQAAVDAAASGVATASTDIQGQMDDIVSTTASDMASLMSSLDQSGSAAAAAASTFSAYNTTATTWMRTTLTTVQSYATQIASALASASASASGLPGYATGTMDADPGFAIVGEKGPEIMYMHGGEHIINAAQTASIMNNVSSANALSAASPAVSAVAGGTNVSVNINIDGNADSGTVNALGNIAQQVKEAVLDALDEIASDRTRTAYA